MGSRRSRVVPLVVGPLLVAAALLVVTLDGAAARAAEAPPSVQASCEHGVLRAVCTKCNPALVPVFKAKGDWCAEHGFPESICPICHPERGGRPALDVSVKKDEGPAEGTKVTFKTADTARLAGIETAKVTELDHAPTVPVTATVVYDATRLAVVNARFTGVVGAIRADVGTLVERGDALASIESAEVGAGRSRLKAAKARSDMAEVAWQRQRELHGKGIAPFKDVEEAQRERDEAQAELASVEASMRLVGASAEASPTFDVRAPLGGVVTERSTTVGSHVEVGAPLFEVVDTSRMWAELDVPEGALHEVAAGQEVTVEVTSLPGRSWSGRIQYVAPIVDPRTRTAKARVPLENRDGALRANMFARARVAVAGARRVWVPESAVQNAKGVEVAFVRLTSEQYETRRIETVLRENGRVVVARGLKAGEEVVTEGSFFLMTETLKDSIGAGCCDVE